MRHRHLTDRRLTRGAASLDAALTGVGPELAAPPLARLGSRLSAADLGPQDLFRAGLRAQLLAAGTVAAAPVREAPHTAARGHSPGWFATRLTAGIAAAGVMVAGVGVASARALPGDALYGLKRDTEAVQLNLAHGDSARGLLHLQFAASRLSEVHSLLARADLASPGSREPAEVPQALAATLRSTLAAMDADTSTGASELTKSFLAQRQGASLGKLAAFTSRQETGLTSVLPALPAPAAATSLGVLHTVAAQTTALLAQPASPPAAGSALPTASPGPAASTPVASASPSAATSTASTEATASPVSPAAGSPTPTAAQDTSTPPAASTAPSGEAGSTDSPTPSPTVSLDAQSPTPEPSSKPSNSPATSDSAAAPTTPEPETP